jgi:hypothetical protein
VLWLFERSWNLDYAPVDAADIAAGGLAGFKVLVVPHGYAPYALQALGRVGKRALTDWVNDGGRYIGLRGGAEVAARLGITTAVLRNNHSNTPGALVRVALDQSSPLAEGVGDFAYVMFEEDRVMTPGKASTVPVAFPPTGTEDFFISGLAEGAGELGGTARAGRSCSRPIPTTGRGRDAADPVERHLRGGPVPRCGGDDRLLRAQRCGAGGRDRGPGPCRTSNRRSSWPSIRPTPGRPPPCFAGTGPGSWSGERTGRPRS